MAEDLPVHFDIERAYALLNESQRALEDMLRAFEHMTGAMQSGERMTEMEMGKSMTSLGRVRRHFLEEVKSYEKHVFESNGLVASAPLDFDQLRSEIGSRLDRLRDAQSAEGVSGEPDTE